jgi:hypothetical protein
MVLAGDCGLVRMIAKSGGFEEEKCWEKLDEVFVGS